MQFSENPAGAENQHLPELRVDNDADRVLPRHHRSSISSTSSVSESLPKRSSSDRRPASASVRTLSTTAPALRSCARDALPDRLDHHRKTQRVRRSSATSRALQRGGPAARATPNACERRLAVVLHSRLCTLDPLRCRTGAHGCGAFVSLLRGDCPQLHAGRLSARRCRPRPPMPALRAPRADPEAGRRRRPGNAPVSRGLMRLGQRRDQRGDA